jgi:aminomethyltransferase
VRKLVGLTIDGDAAPAAGSPIVREEKEIGRVTSAVLSPALRKPIALGYVHRDFIEPGAVVFVAVGDARLTATVTALPFVR